MSKTIEQRPPQVTFAATVVIAASVMVLMSAWERVSSLRSLETRESVEEFLRGPGSGLGVGFEGVLTVLQVSAVLAAVCAAAAAILGFHVLKGDKASRLGLAVAAVPLFLTGLVIGGFASSFVAAATVMLWLEPAREWFATGRWTPPPPRREPAPESPPSPLAGPTAGSLPPADGSGPPPFPTPYATPEAHHGRPPGPHEPAPAPRHAAVRRRPGAVVAAFVVTVVATALVSAFSLLAVVVVAVAPEAVMGELERQAQEEGVDITVAQLQSSMILTGVVCVVLCAVALTFAGFAMRRRPWARRGWLVIAAASAGACLFVLVASPDVVSGLAVMIPAAAAVATVVFLRRPEVRTWFDSATTATERR